MAELVVYACNCSNIRIHTSTEYSLDKINEYKQDLFVKEPFPGFEYELGMGGIVIVILKPKLLTFRFDSNAVFFISRNSIHLLAHHPSLLDGPQLIV